MWARTLATASRASWAMVTWASWRATATTSSGVTPLEPRVTVSGAWVVTVIEIYLNLMVEPGFPIDCSVTALFKAQNGSYGAIDVGCARLVSGISDMGMRTPRSLATSTARS